MNNIKLKEIAEMLTIKDLLEKYPTGILSIVSDTFDLWKVCAKYLPKLKDDILARDGKLVIRPDSGDPVDILCGYKDTDYTHIPNGKPYTEEIHKGVIELLWDIFGGTVNEQGYKVLDSHIGAIYGDSITLERADEICKRLEAKGFASTNVVLGIGSFTYQYNTRDTFGFAMKATYVEKLVGKEDMRGKFYQEKEGFEIFKDPITDDGLKKSAKGLLKVVEGENDLELKDQISWEELREEDNLLSVVYKDGKFIKRTSLTEIRNKINGKNL